MILQQIINGLMLGSTYSLLALGFSLIFGVLSFINFAHGSVSVFGAYVSWYLMYNYGTNPLIAISIAIITAMILGIVIEWIGYKPIRKADPISAIIASLGFSFIIVTLTQIIWGSQSHSFIIFKDIMYIEIGNAILSSAQILVFIISILIMIGLSFFINKSKTGLAIRVISLDKDTSGLMGVNVNRVVSITFALGSALGTISAIMMSAIYGAIYPSMGSLIGTKGFAAVVLGGAGSIPGAMLGGILIGVIESIAGTIFNAQIKDAVAFIVLILVLIIKPSGLLVKERIKE